MTMKIEVKKSPRAMSIRCACRVSRQQPYTNTDAYRGKSVQIDPDSASSAYSHILAVWPSAISDKSLIHMP